MTEKSDDRRSLSKAEEEQLSPLWRYEAEWKAADLISSVGQTGRGGDANILYCKLMPKRGLICGGVMLAAPVRCTKLHSSMESRA